MTTHSRCPLCGGAPTIQEDGGSNYTMISVACDTCGLHNYHGSDVCHHGEDTCWAAWEELVGKFPPFARVHPGDKIRYDAGCEEFDGIVLEIKRDEHNDRTLLVTPIECPWKDRVDSYQIIKWPWDFGQEGGAE